MYVCCKVIHRSNRHDPLTLVLHSKFSLITLRYPQKHKADVTATFSPMSFQLQMYLHLVMGSCTTSATAMTSIASLAGKQLCKVAQYTKPNLACCVPSQTQASTKATTYKLANAFSGRL